MSQIIKYDFLNFNRDNQDSCKHWVTGQEILICKHSRYVPTKFIKNSTSFFGWHCGNSFNLALKDQTILSFQHNTNMHKLTSVFIHCNFLECHILLFIRMVICYITWFRNSNSQEYNDSHNPCSYCNPINVLY